jgi:hypothetical protein
LTTITSRWLVDHDGAVRETKPLSCFSTTEQKRTHRGSLPNANGRDGRLDVGHGVIDRKACYKT